MLCDHCVLLCVVCFVGWLVIWCIVNVLSYVDLRLYILRFVVCWRFDAAGFEWCPCSRLKRNWSVCVVCGCWGLMTVWNSGLLTTTKRQSTSHQTHTTTHHKCTLTLNPPSLQNKTTDVVIQQHSCKLLMLDILMSETCWVHKKWNKIASDIKLVFYSSTITMMDGPVNIGWIKRL